MPLQVFLGMPIFPPMLILSCATQRGTPHRGFPSGHIGGMSRIEYSWQVALQQSLLPLPRSTQPTRISMFDLSAIHRPILAFCGTVHGSLGSQYTPSSVSRSAGLLSLNLRGRRLGAVPANGCLATLPLRWSC